MKKDVIYIDIEDDITSVIERLKSSPEKIVALVPPKGSAVLQSVVNLKLLKRAADSVNKQTVIVTSNQALQSLAGGLGVYVAKNLQSKPMIPGDDDAEELPDDDSVEVSDAVGAIESDTSVSTDDVELSDEEMSALESEDGMGSVALSDLDKTKPKKPTKKVPDFDSFRKKLLIGGGVALVLIILLFVFIGRSKATVVVRAETTPVDVQFDATFDTALSQSDPSQAQIKASSKEQKKSITQTFTPTGQKDLGTPATGTLSLKNCSSSDGTVTIPAGTVASASGLNFVTQSSVSLPASVFSGGGKCLTSSKDVDVTSQDNGDKYNLGSRSYTVSGFTKVTASGSNMTGGTSRIVTVVSQDDINKATEQLKAQDTSSIKSELAKSFGAGNSVLDDSFAVTISNVTSAPAVNAEGNSATLTADASYTILGYKNDDLSNALNMNIISQMTNASQQSVYDNGFKNMKLVKKSADATKAVYTVSSAAQYGPQFDTKALADQIAGKKVGEARATLESLPGVKSADIKLSPFWSSSLPGADKINISTEVDKSISG